MDAEKNKQDDETLGEQEAVETKNADDEPDVKPLKEGTSKSL